MRVERADPGAPAVRALLAEHAREMTRRYRRDGTWEGVAGRKDAVWLAGLSVKPVGVVALRVLQSGRIEVKHLYVCSRQPGAMAWPRR